MPGTLVHMRGRGDAACVQRYMYSFDWENKSYKHVGNGIIHLRGVDEHIVSLPAANYRVQLNPHPYVFFVQA